VTRPWQIVASAERAEGRLELRRRGAGEVAITLGGRVLMNGAAHRSEAALAELACGPIASRPHPRVLVGGLGLGYTLRAALNALPRRAAVHLVEIDPLIVEWCQGPLAELTGRPLADPRVRIEIADVAAVIERAAGGGGAVFDAILLDLYEGPRTLPPHGAGDLLHGAGDPLYGAAALARSLAALSPGGILAVWSEDPDSGFERRLTAAGFAWERRRPAGQGVRHTVYLARHEAARHSRSFGRPGRERQGGQGGGAARPGPSRNPARPRKSRADRDRPARSRRRPGPT
jgi:hypothetical protein